MAKEKRGEQTKSCLIIQSVRKQLTLETPQKIVNMSNYKLPKIEELLEAGVHFGHQVRRWHPKMEPYIYGVKQNIHIIDLEIAHKNLEKACEFLYETASKGGQIIFVGTKKQAHDIVSIEAKRSGAMYVIERWIGGTITNHRVIRLNIDKLLNTIRKKELGELEKYTKKERLLIDREVEKLQRSIGGITALKGVPAALVVVDSKREKTAVREAVRSGVKVVGLVDTNSNPAGVDYVIPGNDDALKSIALILKAFGDAVEAGYKKYAKDVEDKKIEVAAIQAAQAAAQVAASQAALAEAAVVSTDEAMRVAKDLSASFKEAIKEEAEVIGDETNEGKVVIDTKPVEIKEAKPKEVKKATKPAKIEKSKLKPSPKVVKETKAKKK